ncbi:MAG TPA: HPF/RaiA family ribosome-associated protein [Blastocatellia bacterium]|nr:HPF/RaiA family ribosome-associated protein [Blastocatellia bacterium]
MKLPVQITFRNMESSAAVETRIREEAAKLEEFYDRIMGCRVVVEMPHQHRQRGRRFHIRIDLTVPGGEIVVNQEPSLHGSLQRVEGERRVKNAEVLAPHKDAYVAIRDAFRAARRQLQDHVRKRTGAARQHEAMPRARVSRLFPEKGYGFLETPDGVEIYFHRNSVLNGGFEHLLVGTRVSFVEEQGDKGPQASTVKAID